MATDVNADTFDQEVVQSEVPVLVDFWGPKCGPCLALMPAVEGLADTYAGRLKLVKLDASQNKRFCLTMKVLGLPTYLLYKDGKEVDRLTGGELTIHDLEESVKKVVE
jgi:thioredoxin 1